jgi:uncharacterized protein (DUF305 family)
MNTIRIFTAAAFAGLLTAGVAFGQASHNHGAAPKAEAPKPAATSNPHAGHDMSQMKGAAQTPHAGHNMASMKPKGDQGPSSQAFAAINAKMHEGMDITFTGNADVDFVRGMIPHHAGAVDMAKVVLAFGKDPEIRKLAEAVVKAQEAEIAMMNEWLSKNAPK